MPAKKFVCKIDGRSFSTKLSLSHHVRDSHRLGKKASVQGKSHVGSSGAQVQNFAAPVALPTSVRGGGTDVAHMSGTDRIFHGEISNKEAEGAIKCSLLVTPALFTRLATVARAYQRIRYKSLRFVIDTQIGTTTSGGYVVGFVRDPADDVTTLNSLLAQKGSVATKWWQTSSVTATPPNKLFYTSESVEIREFSPGKLILMVDGKASQVGSFTIFAHWTVELTGAGLENPKQIDKIWSFKDDIFSRAAFAGLWVKVGNSFMGTPYALLGAQGGQVFKLANPFILMTENGNIRTAHWVVCKGSNVYPAYQNPTDIDTNVLKTDDLLATKGQLVEDVSPEPAPPAFSGEVERPLSSDFQTTMAALAKLLSALEPSSLSQLGNLLSKPSTSSQLTNDSEESSA